MLALLAACHDRPDPSDRPSEPTTAGPPAFTVAPRIEAPASDAVALVQRVVAATTAPTRAVVVLDDGERRRQIAFPALAAEHDLALLGLFAETAYTAEATFTDADGVALAATLSFTTGPALGPLPDLDVLVAERDRMEPGFTVFPTQIDEVAVIVAVDADGRPVWTWSTGRYEAGALGFADGVFSALLGGEVLRWTPAGEVLGNWFEYAEAEAEGDIELPFLVHHEAVFEPDGSFWTFLKEAIAVDAYPTSTDDPSVTAPATVLDDHVVHIAPDGQVLHDFSMAERLDPQRIGFNSLEVLGYAYEYDWSHANSLTLTPDGSGLVVSLRHQDALVKLSLPDGEVDWILANPDGWTPELDLLRLTEVGTPFGWPYHQHAPMYGPDGRLWLFDNGNFRGSTPYSETVALTFESRVVAYEIDEVARTVRQVFEHPGSDGGLFSIGYGNADAQPTTGTVLATYGGLRAEDDGFNLAAGRGSRSVRLVEVDPVTSDVVFDLRLSTALGEWPGGVVADRAIRVPTLYGPDVVETWLD